MAEQIEKKLADLNLDEAAAVALIEELKADLGKHRTRKTDLESATTKLKDYEAKAEADRLAKLSEDEKIREQLTQKEKALLEKDAELVRIKKDSVLKDALFEALKDKPMSKVRRGLYMAAAKELDWKDAAELAEAFKAVDAEIEEDVKTVSKRETLPGDKVDDKATRVEQGDFKRKLNPGPKLIM